MDSGAASGGGSAGALLMFAKFFAPRHPESPEFQPGEADHSFGILLLRLLPHAFPAPCHSEPWRRLRPRWLGAAGPLILLLVLPLASLHGQEIGDAKALMRKIDALWRGQSSRAVITMIVKTRRYERKITMETWSEGREKSLVRILQPKKDRGIATLKVGKNIWNYLPKVDRVAKIPPSMMLGSWMGSHFTNDDLVKESSFEEDYVSEISFRGLRSKQRIIEVTSTPRPDAVVVWGKVVTEIEEPSLLPLKATYYDEDGQRTRTLIFEAPRRFGDRLAPSRLVLVPEDKPEEFTTLVYEEIEFDLKLPRALFSLRELRSR